MQYSQPRNNGCPVVFNNTPYAAKKQQNPMNQPIPRQKECVNTCEEKYDPHYDQRHDQRYEQHDDCHRDRDHCDNHDRHDTNYGRAAGMVYHAPHGLCNMYGPSQALRNGTLYAELDKPLMHYTADENQGWHTPEQAIAFSAWELRLYLNTHPKDKQALKYFQQLHQQMDVNYATTFAPCAANGRTWDWIDDPWPWEYAANCDRRG